MTNKRNLTHSGRALGVASVLLFPFVTPSAGALVTIGDQTRLFFNGSATARYDDNIFLSDDNEESDTIFIISPGLELNVGARENANINLFYREDIYSYQDNSELDENLSNVFFESYWEQARLDLRFDASFQELMQATSDLVRQAAPDFNELILRDLFKANARGEYELSELTSASVGVGYSSLDFETRGYVDRDVVSVPVNFYWAARPQLDLSVGYRYRHTDNDAREPILFANPLIFGPEQDVPNYTDHYFNVGARGEVAPKLVGEARAGYQLREVEDNSDRDSLSFGVDFSHFTTPNTTLLIGLSRDFETGGEGDSVTRTGGSLGARHTFSHLVSGSAGVNYYDRDYAGSGRQDETLDLNVGVSYSPIVYVDLSANYTYRQNESNDDSLDFTNNIFSVSAALRY